MIKIDPKKVIRTKPRMIKEGIDLSIISILGVILLLILTLFLL